MYGGQQETVPQLVQIPLGHAAHNSSPRNEGRAVRATSKYDSAFGRITDVERSVELHSGRWRTSKSCNSSCSTQCDDFCKLRM